MDIEIIGEVRDVIRSVTRVAAYCRVSDDGERLLGSLEAQKAHYLDLMPVLEEGSVPVGVYCDEAVTGTKADRPALRKLLKDCEDGLVDKIVVKSVSRLSRNTVDLLNICRTLAGKGIDVYFEKENFSFMTMSGELMISLIASIAQEESRSISENIKWGIRKGFEQGRSARYRLYGYTFDENGFHVVPRQAAVVRSLYEDYLAGGTAERMAKRLAAEGVPGPMGGNFNPCSIRRILANPTYTGDSVLQREYIEDHMTHKRKRNEGELAMYIVKNTHPTIVSHELFDAVQSEAARRRALGKNSGFYQKSWYSGRIVCGECGRSFRLQRKKGTPGSGTFFCKGLDLKACTNIRVSEAKLTSLVASALGKETVTEEEFSESVARITVFRNRIAIALADGRCSDCPS